MPATNCFGSMDYGATPWALIGLKDPLRHPPLLCGALVSGQRLELRKLMSAAPPPQYC